MKRKTGLQKAIEAAGSQTALAKLLKIKPQAVQRWTAKGLIPWKRCKDVSKKTGISLNVLRPDIWGK